VTAISAVGAMAIDRFTGGKGSDTLYGGTEADTSIWTSGGNDRHAVFRFTNSKSRSACRRAAEKSLHQYLCEHHDH
jgi:hypothetical protein